MQRLDNVLQLVVERVVNILIPQGLNLRFDLIAPTGHLTLALKRAIHWDLLLCAITDQSDGEQFQIFAKLAEARKKSVGDAQIITDYPNSYKVSFQDAYNLVLAALKYGREKALQHLLDLRPYCKGPAFLLRALEDDEVIVRKFIDDDLESVQPRRTFLAS
ncbi:hypothetical protein N7G274_009266 [Stereocaulon virgatum]|uniref:Uncharacterized protein n=1 Tax=Stereocaulon virgatum TaxID=373712 RepID=A0ABR3ZZC0_9LECA